MRGRVVINGNVIELGNRVMIERSVTTYLGIGQRSPIMANGQVPGIRRQYDTSYALVLAEQQGPVATYYARKDTER